MAWPRQLLQQRPQFPWSHFGLRLRDSDLSLRDLRLDSDLHFMTCEHLWQYVIIDSAVNGVLAQYIAPT